MEQLSCWHCIHAEIISSVEEDRKIVCRADPRGLTVGQDLDQALTNPTINLSPESYWCNIGTWAIRYWHQTNLWNKSDIIKDSGVRDSKTVRLITRDGKNIEARVPWMGTKGKWMDWEGESWASF